MFELFNQQMLVFPLEYNNKSTTEPPAASIKVIISRPLCWISDLTWNSSNCSVRTRHFIFNFLFHSCRRTLVRKPQCESLNSMSHPESTHTDTHGHVGTTQTRFFSNCQIKERRAAWLFEGVTLIWSEAAGKKHATKTFCAVRLSFSWLKQFLSK